jgi:hypothetical protein
MEEYNRYDDGQMVRISASFTDVEGKPTDPSVVTLRYKDPSNDTVYVKTGTEIVKDATGEYHFDLDTTDFSKGAWHYKWIGTGTVTAAQSWAFIIKVEETQP